MSNTEVKSQAGDLFAEAALKENQSRPSSVVPAGKAPQSVSGKSDKQGSSASVGSVGENVPGVQGRFQTSGGGGGVRPIERVVAPTGRGWGKGPIPIDRRRFRYDVLQARAAPALAFSASKMDRLDAVSAGDMLHSIHEMFALDRELEPRILAFDRALWFEHTVNGASLAQPGRGSLLVDGVSFDIRVVKDKLGVDQRRFFRAYADEIAESNRSIIASLDPYDPLSVEMVGQLKQVAQERGLHKFPHLAHDSSDACLEISFEERSAIMASKRLVIATTANAVDVLPQRVEVTAE